MKYTKPAITNTTIASLAIQGSTNKDNLNTQDGAFHSTMPAYSADE